jgi:hypothetical protein
MARTTVAGNGHEEGGRATPCNNSPPDTQRDGSGSAADRGIGFDSIDEPDRSLRKMAGLAAGPAIAAFGPSVTFLKKTTV